MIVCSSATRTSILVVGTAASSFKPAGTTQAKRRISADKGKISDNSMDAKKARHIKLAEKLKRRRAAKKEMKESKMSDSD